MSRGIRPTSSGARSNEHTLVWDLPTRLFHWMLVISFSVAWVTSDDNRYLDFHVFGGYTFFGLLVFRTVWGMVGSHYAHFRTFAHNWSSLHGYAKGLLNGQATRYLGHNPIGGLAILVMIGLGFLVSISGLVVFGGEEGHGPLAGVIPFEVGHAAKNIHEILVWLMLGLVAVHIIGVIAESFIHKENLIWSMFSGYKEGRSTNSPIHGAIGAILLTLVFGSAVFFFRGYMLQTPDRPYMPFQGPTLVFNETWQNACSECHLAYHPTLLPARSWQKIADTQHDHFGEDLFLDDDTLQEITDFMINNSAETGKTEPAHLILNSIPSNETPLKITETPYWIYKHSAVKPAYWKDKNVRAKDNCGACHFDAKEGTFEDFGIHVPTLSEN